MILIGLGSNRGDSIELVLRAMDRLAYFAAGPVNRSSLYRTAPVDCPPDSDPFINAVVAFTRRDDVTARGLLVALKGIEREFGRPAAAIRNAPRLLDLDLLLFDGVRISTPAFTVPHPRAHRRRFVLAPAAEIVPELEWPGTGRSVAALLAALPAGEDVEQLAPEVAGSDRSRA